MRDPLNTRAIPERLMRGVFTTRKAIYKSTFTFTFTYLRAISIVTELRRLRHDNRR